MGSSVNEINTSVDQTVRIFDQFYKYDVNVPAEEYDIVYSYFGSVFVTKEAAANFTSALFQVASETKVPAVDLLRTFYGQDKMQLTTGMAYYLNGIRSPSTLLGVINPTVPNYYTARNVRS